MLKDAIRLTAAALCSAQKNTTFRVAPDAALSHVLALILQLTAYAEMADDGAVCLEPMVRAPEKTTLRFHALPKPLFYLFSGVAAKMDLNMLAEPAEEVTDAELRILSAAMGGTVVFAKTAGGILQSSCTAGDGIEPAADCPPAFAAGAVLGAAMARADTTFMPGTYLAADETRVALKALKEFGCKAENTAGGGVTVRTLRGAFDPKTGKRIRKRA